MTQKHGKWGGGPEPPRTPPSTGSPPSATDLPSGHLGSGRVQLVYVSHCTGTPAEFFFPGGGRALKSNRTAHRNHYHDANNTAPGLMSKPRRRSQRSLSCLPECVNTCRSPSLATYLRAVCVCVCGGGGTLSHRTALDSLSSVARMQAPSCCSRTNKVSRVFP